MREVDEETNRSGPLIALDFVSGLGGEAKWEGRRRRLVVELEYKLTQGEVYAREGLRLLLEEHSPHSACGDTQRVRLQCYLVPLVLVEGELLIVPRADPLLRFVEFAVVGDELVEVSRSPPSESDVVIRLGQSVSLNHPWGPRRIGLTILEYVKDVVQRLQVLILV